MAKVTNKRARERLDATISKLIVFRPLFGTVFLFLNKMEALDIPTMAVGVTRRVDLALYYNPEFVESLTTDELKAVLIHEALHVLLHHITRATHFNYNMRNYNITADMAINCNIVNLPEGAFYPSAFNLPDFESAEWYYESLKKEADKNGQEMSEYADGKGELVDDHSKWGECEEDVIKEKVRGIAAKAIKEQEKKGWGDIPGKVAQQVIAANKPIINWKKEVRYFINKLVLAGRRSTRMRPNRRYGYTNPGSKRDYTSKLLVGIDTSGSVSDRELTLFLDELNGMIDHVQCDLIFFDTRLYDKPKPFDKKAKKLNVKGRGGTAFEPIIKLVDELKYDGLIVMTDGYAPFPTKPRARLLWCLSPSGESVVPPYGKRVVVDLKKRR
jgi:predicted metal-dependent peptidase